MKFLDVLTRIPQETRAVLYRVSTAGVFLAGTYGLVSEQQAAGWAALALALFGGTMAVANTSREVS